MTNTEHKQIDAERLLAAKFPEAKTEYQHGWNDALQAAYENEPEVQCGREEVKHGTSNSTNKDNHK